MCILEIIYVYVGKQANHIKYIQIEIFCSSSEEKKRKKMKEKSQPIHIQIWYGRKAIQMNMNEMDREIGTAQSIFFCCWYTPSLRH